MEKDYLKNKIIILIEKVLHYGSFLTYTLFDWCITKERNIYMEIRRKRRKGEKEKVNGFYLLKSRVA